MTWIGKDNRPKLEPRILIEDPGQSYHAKLRMPIFVMAGSSRLTAGASAGKDNGINPTVVRVDAAN
ncbi:MAG: hypothetical protein PHU80_03870 [Kiritimatiellae bacterium]|nr:hypothetical protein [Kiritimatiellia bacterium]